MSFVAQQAVLGVGCLLFSAAAARAESSTVMLPSGERCVAGQAIVKLASPVMPDKLPGLRELLRRWNVTDFEPIVPGGARVAVETGADRLYLVSFNPDADVQQAVAEFGLHPDVTYACPNALLALSPESDATPNDPRYPEQWQLLRIRAPRAWDSAHGDSGVIVALIDDGLSYNHEDIGANVWVNSSEDINHNRRFDPLPPPDGDLDGVDQDGNGYADDVIGYDFIDGDPNPLPGPNDDHGTHGWGVANAVTDNGIGIAAPPWNVRGMALRCGNAGYINMAAAISGIYYSVAQGAWVVSMAWGTRTPYQPLADACEFVWNSGRLALASAGSSSGGEPVYPAAFPGVLAVAASDQNDMKAPFSGYGTWVDLCAPGVEILSTVGDSDYIYWDGTAGATQTVAGVLCWLKSRFPGITNDSAQALLFGWCDSMPDPLYPQGLLGHGRVAMTPDTLTGIRGQVERPGAVNPALVPAVIRGTLFLPAVGGQWSGAGASLLDISGRKVIGLKPGPNVITGLAPGVYFVRGRTPGSIRKVIVQK